MSAAPYDVIVIGAGPGGACTAFHLAKAGLRPLLLERARFPRDKTCGDGLTPRALAELERMEVLHPLARESQPITALRLYPRKGPPLEMPVPPRKGFPDHLLIIPRLKLDDRLRRQAQSAGAVLWEGAHVEGITYDGRQVEVHGRLDGRTFKTAAPLAVLAVGANMALLRKLDLLPRSLPLILAARAYYCGIGDLGTAVEAHFQDVPLPGYGWIFPLDHERANVGIGYWSSRRAEGGSQGALARFLEGPALRGRMQSARALGPIKGFPIRTDFASAKTWSPGILLVGESAGLVSPLTGEGIDFALESGRMAAEHIRAMFRDGDFSLARFQAYDTLLRTHFQRLFIFLERIRRLYINPLLVDRFIHTSRRRPALQELLAKVLLGQADAAKMVTWSVLRQVLLGI